MEIINKAINYLHINTILKLSKFTFINIIFAIFLFAINIILILYSLNKVPLIVTIIAIFILLAYFIIILNIIRILHITSKSLLVEKNHNETLNYLYDNVKAFKHDFDNMVFVIGGFIENKDIDKLSKYYKNLEKDCEQVNNLAVLSPTLINDAGIYNLLMSKYKKAKEYEVEIKLEFFFDLQKLYMPIYDFSRMLGILLDNSLEAAKDSIEKQVTIVFRDSKLNHTQIISIENSYSNKDVDTSLIFEKGKTSKDNHSGMGLWEVQQILNRNNNVNLITTKDEDHFKQTIEIYY